MFFLETYFNRIVKYDLINTFTYSNLTKIPKLEKIVLNFGYQKSNLKYIISGLLALEFITSKKSSLTKSKNLNLFLKIKKGNPVGCKVILRKNTMYHVYTNIINSIFLKAKRLPKYQFQ
jgi:large subunit ribosomal protein L5